MNRLAILLIGLAIVGFASGNWRRKETLWNGLRGGSRTEHLFLMKVRLDVIFRQISGFIHFLFFDRLSPVCQ